MNITNHGVIFDWLVYMKQQTFRRCLECVSFIMWIAFTIFSLALAGLGIEGILLAAFMVMVSSSQPVQFPIEMASVGGLGVFLSIFWRQVGVDHLHYLQYDSPAFAREDDDAPSHVLEGLIREVEMSTGYARNDARAKAKTWLVSHASSLDEEDVQLARSHFGYMLPAEWGESGKR